MKVAKILKRLCLNLATSEEAIQINGNVYLFGDTKNKEVWLAEKSCIMGFKKMSL